MSASDLSFDEIDYQTALEAFEIEDRTNTSFPTPHEDYRMEVPALLDSLLAEARGIQVNANNDSFRTYALSSILFFCLVEAKRHLKILTSTSSKGSSSPTNHVLGAAKYIECTIELHKEQSTARGMANYTFRTNQGGPTGIDMLVVQASRTGAVGLLDHLVVTLLGAVHRAKLLDGKDLVSVFAIATDSTNFRFWNINENSELHQSRLYEWHKGDGPAILTHITRALHFSMAYQTLETAMGDTEESKPVDGLPKSDIENSHTKKKRKLEAIGGSLSDSGEKENRLPLRDIT